MPQEPNDRGQPTSLPSTRDHVAPYGEAAVDRACELLSEVPQQIGPYRILEKLGFGGMGEVYRAEQRTPIRREVALKLIKLGMDTKLVIARFEAERQALALMDHPHIAKVYEANSDETGRPYFVMEYVKGKPITQYANLNHLTVHERLELFQQVCHAIQHAHCKGIIHRDIKPSNVLTSTQDGRPHAKVIDFGVAKAISQQLTELTLYTLHDQFIGTPQYMSPEQAEGSLDIDTRTDVYSLGVLLYELLTGSTPFTTKDLKAVAIEQIKKLILEVEPPKPSTRLSPTEPTLATLAAQRRVDPRKLGTLIRGELDWIVMMSLEKDRRRRYESPNSLADDIARYLGGNSVVAAPPSTIYRFRKFVRKNRVPVIAGSALATTMAIGLAGTTWQWRRANENASEARNNADLISEQKDEADHQRDLAELEAYIANLALAQSALNSDNYPEARRYIANCPISKRGWEWGFLNEKANSVAIMLGHDCDSASWSPNGQIVLTKEKQRLPTTYSSRLVDRNETAISIGVESELYLRSAEFSPDGQLVLTASNDNTARLWDLGGKSVGLPMPHNAIYCSPVFSPNGQLILTVDLDTIRVWDLNGKPVGPCIKLNDNIHWAKFSPNGKVVLTSDDQTTRLWELNGKPVGLPMPHYAYAQSTVFSPDGQLVLTVNDKTARLWDLDGKPVGLPMPHNKNANSPVFSPDGQLVLTSADQTARLWDLNGNPVGLPMPHDLYWRSPVFSPDGQLILTIDMDSVQVWDVAGKPVGAPIRDYTGVQFATFCSADNAILTVTYGMEVSLWNVGPNHRDPSSQITLQSNVDTTVGGAFQKRTHNGVRQLRSQGALIGFGASTVSFSPDGDFILFADDEETYDHDLGLTTAVVRSDRLGGPERAIDPDGEAELEICALFASELYADATTKRSSDSAAQSEFVSPTSANVVRFGWNSDLKAASELGNDDALNVVAAAYSSDRSRIATASSKSVRVWDSITKRLLVHLTSTSPVRDLSFTPNGSRLVLRLEDASFQIWDSRPYEDRQKDRDARFREQAPADEYVKKLLNSEMPFDQLVSTVINDRTLPILRKAVAAEQLTWEMGQLERKSQAKFDALIKECLTKEEVIAAVQRIETKDRTILYGGPLVKLANEWKGHNAEGLSSIALEIASQSNRTAEEYLRAVKAAEMAVALDPVPNGPHIGTLGMSLYRAGQFERALSELQRREEISKAAKEEILFSTIVFNAMTLFRLNRVEEANAALDLANSRKTENEDALKWQQEAIGLIRPEKVNDN